MKLYFSMYSLQRLAEAQRLFLYPSVCLSEVFNYVLKYINIENTYVLTTAVSRDADLTTGKTS